MEENCPLTGRPCSKPRFFHITEVQEDGKTVDLNLCEDCLPAYVGHGNNLNHSIKKIEHKKTNKMENMVHELFQFILSGMQKLGVPDKPPCPKCNSSYTEIVKRGKVGCSHCWEHFAEELNQVIKKVQSSTQHAGKIPKNWQQKQFQEQKDQMPIPFKIKILEDMMKKAIAAEEYEKAAKLRDTIKKFTEVTERYETLKNQLEIAQAKKEPIDEISQQLAALLEEVNHLYLGNT
jgi:protein arginine kinase activator